MCFCGYMNTRFAGSQNYIGYKNGNDTRYLVNVNCNHYEITIYVCVILCL
jgi:hypothetical protein